MVPKRRKGGRARVKPKRRSDPDREILRFNMLCNLSRTLLDLSSAERQIAYKAAVPFVHVPRELRAQYDDYIRMLKEARLFWACALFRDCFSESQRKAMIKFDHVIEATRRSFPDAGPDVPEILEEPAWRRVMTEAAVLHRMLADVLPQPPEWKLRN